MVSKESPIPGSIDLDAAAQVACLQVFGDWVMVNLTVEQAKMVLRDDPLAPASSPRLDAFVVCDARGAWTMVSQVVYIYSSAELLYGSIPKSPYSSDLVTCMALMSGNQSRTIPPAFDPDRPATGTRRLTIGAGWENLVLVGRPFVVRTSRGYVPALRARLSSGELVHVLLGAQSLCKGLFELASDEEDFTGISVRMRKQSDSRTAPYIVEETESADGC